MNLTPNLVAWRAANVADVVTKLIFFLIAQNGKLGDGGDVLIVAEGFKTSDGAGCGGKWKCQSKSQVRIARLGQVQKAGIEYKANWTMTTKT